MEQTKLSALMQQAQLAKMKGNLREAIACYEEILTKNSRNSKVLGHLIQCKYEMKDFLGAASLFGMLQKIYPQDPNVYAKQSDLYLLAGNLDEAIKPYKKLIGLQPRNVTAHFNLARLLAKSGQTDRAFRQFEKCLKLNIDQPEEVLLNQASLMAASSRHSRAVQLLKNAIQIAPNYAEAYFNLATLEEELGNKEKAIRYYRKVLDVNPEFNFGVVFERLAIAGAFTESEDSLLRHAESISNQGRANAPMMESLNYGLGKCFNDLADYEKAFNYYSKANSYSKKRVGEYDHKAMEAYVDEVIDIYTTRWISENKLDNPHQPIFITGMFRSGSTLLEQVLSRHPKIACGSEISYFSERLRFGMRNLSATTARMQKGLDLQELAEGYIDTLKRNYGRVSRVTDKRPDNFLYIGLIKTLFPNAKIIITRRNPLDNILSVYFQNMGGNLPYANDLSSIAHFYRQFDRLSHYWQEIFGEEVCEIRYESFINNQQETTAKLLNYCALNWYQPCLEFHKSGNAVNTASVWQVRQQVYKSSLNRSQNYAKYLDSAKAVLSKEGITF